MKKFRLPRKAKKKIPKGVYCYTYTKEQGKKFEETGILNCTYCPFHGNKLDEEYDYIMEWCKLVKCEITDSYKSCRTKNNLK